jgi:tRNA dimethylallyltransferase
VTSDPVFAVTICGPTACGKTDLALALARQVATEIISVDSAMVYQGMDIGTAKPDPEILASVPHHLIDILDPVEQYSAGRFVSDATRIMAEIHARGALPVLVGGTMLYFKALQTGLSRLPEADWRWRASIEVEAERIGWPALHARLARVDPQAADRINPGDPHRIQRALEVYHLTGIPITALQAEPLELPGTRYLNLGLVPADRQALGERIQARFDAMLADGLVKEVQGLFDRGDLSAATSSMRAVGYRQVWDHVAGGASLGEARQAAIVATRRLAKRQLTWLRGRSDLHCFEPFDPQVLGWLLARVTGKSPGD